MKCTKQDFLELREYAKTYLTKSNVVTYFMCKKFNKTLNQIHFCTADDELYCGMPWSDYGNYKSKGLEKSHEYFTIKVNGPSWQMSDWDSLRHNGLVLVLVDFNDRKAYRVACEGNYYSHSENNDCPERFCIRDVVDMPNGMDEIIDFYWAEKDNILDSFDYEMKKLQETRRAEDIQNYENKIFQIKKELEGLRKNATKKRRALEQSLSTLKIRLANVKTGETKYIF